MIAAACRFNHASDDDEFIKYRSTDENRFILREELSL